MQREKVSMFPYIVIIRLKREKEEEEQKKESKENQPQNTKQKLFTKKESKNCWGKIVYYLTEIKFHQAMKMAKI